MPTLTAADIADLVLSTRVDEGVGKFNQIAQRLTKYTVMDALMREEKQEFQSGTAVQGNLLVNHNFSAQMVGLHQVIEPNIPDVMTTFQAPWRHSNFNWAVERREILMNRGAQAIFSLMNSRRIAAWISEFELLESQVWNKPVDSTNKTDVFGFPYWIVKATSNTPGFNGGNPSGFTSGAGGIDSTSAAGARWKNWNDQYVVISEDDLLDAMCEAFAKTNFKSPSRLRHEDYSRGQRQHRIMTNYSVQHGLSKEARTRNDNHEGELARWEGMPLFKGTPIEYVPKLDDDTDNPVYMLNFEWIALVFLSGDFLYEHDPAAAPNQPNTIVTHVDCTKNMVVTNRREQAVISLAS